MALDLSKYINKRIPLPKEKMSVYELADYLTDEGYEITKITNSPANKLVYVNNQYHITLRGLVRKIGRNKENFSAWEKEGKSSRFVNRLILTEICSIYLQRQPIMLRLRRG